MGEIKQEVLKWFNSINEFDKRLYIRDMADGLIYDNLDCLSGYPSESLTFIKLARIVHYELDGEKFMEEMDKLTCQDEELIDKGIIEILNKATSRANEFNKMINETKSIYERSL